MKKNQYQKKGIALIYLAKKFFTFSVGNQLPTIDQICQESNISRGTIQGALDCLKEDGAIETVSRGHLGTYLTAIDQDKLLNYLDDRNIVGAMPLPYTSYYEGLSTGFYKVFNNEKLTLNMAYVNGSVSRLKGLLNNRYDFIVVSGLTSDYLLDHYEVDSIKTLPAHTYLSEHVIVFRKNTDAQIMDGMKVGVDSNSIDYAVLTKKILNHHNVQLVEMPYNQIVQRIQGGDIDAAIWNKDEVIEKNYPVDYQKIDSDLIEKASRASLICRKNDTFTEKIISSCFDFNKLLHIQQLVISKKIFPEY
ncbi:MAG: GntR family transcriptional regulator [Sporolactobacillus sp.]|nr:GntR family transcriptional regulator [Sporolactobacillus sp.]